MNKEPQYESDNWVIVQIQDNEGSIAGWKVLSGTSGGYAYGDSWKMNSGIKRYEDIDDYYLFHGYSGSIYKCLKGSEGIRMNIADTLKQVEDTGFAKKIDFKDFKKEFDNL